MDEEDLREKYKAKPEQLANLLQHATQRTHPTRRCTMYEDADLTLTHVDEEEHLEKRRRVMETEQKIKKTKAPKVLKDKKPSAIIAEEDDEPIVEKLKPLSKALLKKIENYCNKYQKLITECLAQQATVKASDYIPHIPPFQITKLNTIIEEAEAFNERVSKISEEGEATKSAAVDLIEM